MTKPLEIVTEVPTENQIRNAIAEYLLYQGYLVLRINSGAAVTIENGKRRFVSFVKWFAAGEGAQTAGVSDLLAFKISPDGKACTFIGVECKVPGNNPTPPQLKFLTEVERHGGIPIVARSIEDVQARLKECGLLQEVA